MNSKYQLKKLKNGLRIILAPMPQIKSVTALLLVKTGSRNEKEHQAGISHFLEHMVFKGTKRYPTALKLASTVDGVGAEFNAFTDKEYTGFYVKSSSNHLDLALEILKELVFYPLILSKEIEKEKGVIVEEINMREDQPMAKVGEEFEILLYGLTALGRKVIGEKKTVKALKRKNFLKYRQQWYHPKNMVLCLAGAVGQPLLNLKDWDEITREGYCQKRTSTKEYPLEDKRVRLSFKKTEQAHFCLGVPAFKRTHKDRYVLAVLATILGGNMSSRLFNEIRAKRGLAYYVSTSTEGFQDTGYLVTQAGVDLGKIEETVKVIREEYEKVQKSSLRQGYGRQAKVPGLAEAKPRAGKVKSLELKRAKEYLKGHLILGLEDSKGVASLYAEDLLLEESIKTQEEILRGIEKVTKADVVRVAREIFAPGRLYLAVVGPYKDRQRFEKLLG